MTKDGRKNIRILVVAAIALGAWGALFHFGAGPFFEWWTKTILDENEEWDNKLDAANALMAQRKFEEATKVLIPLILDVKRHPVSGSSARLASCYYALGGNYLFMEDYPRAKDALERSLQLREADEDTKPEQIARPLRRLADVSNRMQDFQQGEAYARRDLAALESVYGKESRELVRSLSNLKVALEGQNKTDEAAEVGRRLERIEQGG